MKKHANLMSGLAALTVLALAACAPAPTTEEPSTQAPETEAPPTEKTQIRWFVGLGTGTDPEQQPVQEQVVAEFNASHPNIELVLEVVPYDSARDALSTQIAAGNGPDIVGPVGWSGSNAYYGEWLDVGPFIESSGYDTTQFSQELVAFYQTEEGQVGLPFAVFPAAVFYQRSLFDEAGLNYPPASYGEMYVWPDGTEAEWNYDTLAEVARLLTVDVNGYTATEDGFDRDQVVQVGYVAQWQHPNHIGSFWQAAKIYDENNNAVIPDAWAAAWRWWFDGIWGEQPFIANGALSGSPEFGTDNVFNSGKAAMAITHMWYTCCLADAGSDWDVAALPSYQGVVHGRVDADTFRIWEGTQHPEEAFEVLTYLIGPAAEQLLPIYGGMPARPDEIDAFFEVKGGEYPFVTNWDVMQAGLAYPDAPSGEGYMPNWNEAWNRIETFGNLILNDETIDFDAELQRLEDDLTLIFQS